MARRHIFVVEDEEEIQELVRYNLAKEGYDVTCVESGERALRQIASHAPDLVLLDLMLPGLDGLEVCKLLKRNPETVSIPIIILTAKSEDADVVTGLELGAEDYITKPFSPRVLSARIKAVLRRGESQSVDQEQMIRCHNLAIHPGRHEVLIGGKPVSLTATEFRVLHALVLRPGWVLTRSQIADAVHGGDLVVTQRSVDVHIVALRRKLGSESQWLETVRGVGYRFRE